MDESILCLWIFFAGHWKCPGHPESCETYNIIAQQGPYISIRVLHGLKIALFYFRSTIVRLFEFMKEAFKAWNHDFILDAKSENAFMA